MRKIKYLIFIAVISVFFTGMSVYADNTEDKPQFDDSTVLVIMKPKSNGIKLYSAQSAANSAYSVFDELGITDIETIATIPSETKGGISLFSVSAVNGDKDILKLKLPEGGEENVLAAVETLNESGTVEYAQPDFYYYTAASYTPNDTYYSSRQYSLRKVNAPNVWNIDVKCTSVTVAVLDSGMLTTHEDLAQNLWTNPDTDSEVVHGWDFTTNTADVTDGIGHGTHVAGIVSAVTDNYKGIASLARDAKIAPLAVFSSTGNSKTSWIIKAIEYVREMDFPIANCSWGSGGFPSDSGLTSSQQSDPDRALKDSMSSCKNTLFIMAAGNDGQDIDETPYYPASFSLDNSIAVAATNSEDSLAVFSSTTSSSYGANTVDIAAPGSNIYSTIKSTTGSYGYDGGTSMAAPLVASAAAVIKAKYPSLTPVQIKQAILEGADTVSELDGKINGARRLNAYEALKVAGSPYTVTWKSDDNTVIDTTYVEYKATPSHADAVKEDTEEFSYTFTGWSPEIKAVTDNITYTANFKETRIAAKITWKNEDGTVIESEYVKLGEMPYHDGPIKESDEHYEYTFIGWTPEIEAVSEDAEYIAQFEAVSIDALKKTLSVTDKYSEQFGIEATMTESGDLLLTVIPAVSEIEDIPNISAYMAIYNDNGELEKIEKTNFTQLAASVAFTENKTCRLLIWTDKFEPITYTIDDMADFWNAPSQ